MAVACLAGFHERDRHDRAGLDRPRISTQYRQTQGGMLPGSRLAALLIVSSVGP